MAPGFFVLFDVCCLMSLRRPECRLGSLMDMVVLYWLVVRSCGQVLIPPTGGSSPVNVMSSSMYPSITPQAAAFTSSLCVTQVCDFTLPMCVLYSRVSLPRVMSSVSLRRSLRGWG